VLAKKFLVLKQKSTNLKTWKDFDSEEDEELFRVKRKKEKGKYRRRRKGNF
jgi:hypothetical protein